MKHVLGEIRKSAQSWSLHIQRNLPRNLETFCNQKWQKSCKHFDLSILENAMTFAGLKLQMLITKKNKSLTLKLSSYKQRSGLTFSEITYAQHWLCKTHFSNVFANMYLDILNCAPLNPLAAGLKCLLVIKM